MDLSSSPVYEALSYVWGEMEPKENYFIDIEGTNVEITPNIYRALHALRMKDSFRVLWVDSLCINQRDNKDKDIQISMMLEISSPHNMSLFISARRPLAAWPSSLS